MKKKKFILLIAILAIMASWTHFKPSSMAAHPMLGASFAQEESGLQVTSKKYSREESTAFLSRDIEALGYIPIEIVIQNNTPKSYTLSAASVPLACSQGSDVAWSVTKKSIPVSIGFKIASLFFWPLAIPDTINSIHTYKSHRALAKNLNAKTLKQQDEIIPPYTAVKRVIYIAQDVFHETFSVALQEVDGEELVVIPTTIG